MLKIIAGLGVAGLLFLPARAEELVAGKVAKLPAIDGKADDEAWAKAKELVVKIDQPGEEKPAKKLSMKAVHDGDSVCILVVWSDADKSAEHVPFLLKGDTYEPDEEKIEDSCALGFELEGKFDSDMRAGIESKWDVWEFGAARTSGGYAKDKTHIYTKTKPAEPVKSRRLTDRDQGQIYLVRPDDAGTPAYKKIDAPTAKGAAVIQQFQPQAPSGSGADVAARGEWAGGKWTVEFKRKLKTGNADDTVFSPGKSVMFAVATFDKAEKSDHDVSGNLVLKFE